MYRQTDLSHSFVSLAQVTALLVVLPNIVHGALILDFSADGSVTNFDVAPGSTIQIPIYLRQLSAGADHPNLSENAIRVFGFKADLTGDATVNSFAFASPYIDQIGNASSSGSDYVILNGYDPNGGVTGSSIELGSITVLANSLATSTLSLSDVDLTLDDFAAADPSGGGFDDAVFASPKSVTINATAVPEPASFALIGVAVAAVAARSRFKRGWGKKTPDTV